MTKRRYFLILVIIAVVGVSCFFLQPFVGYHSIGFILLFTILSISTTFSLGPTFFAAFLSALLWNYFFIPPRFTLHITAADDFMMLLSFFGVAVTCGYYSSTVQRQKLLIHSEKVKYLSQLEESMILKQSEKLHQTLLNSVSHELRTPLTSILGSSSALLSRPHLPSELKPFIEDINASAIRLHGLTGELLDMSRLSSGVLKPNFVLFELNDFLHQVLGKYEDLFRDHKLVFENNGDELYVSGDEGLLDLCFYNLLKNAVIYSPPDFRIMISTSKLDGKAVIKIRDFGIGIIESEEEKIFLPFYRISKTPFNEKPHQSEGLGLGLSIAKSIVDLHSGTISLKSASNKTGTEACVQLDLSSLALAQKENSDIT